MPIPFERFRFLNGTRKEVENVDYQRPLRVRVDDHPEIVVPPGEKAEIPEGAVVEVIAEEVP
jgi:hypothetical protein